MTMDTSIRDINFEYEGVTEKHSYSESCRESGCDREGICRCSVIVDAKIHHIDSAKAIHAIANRMIGWGNKPSKQALRDIAIAEVLDSAGPDIDFYTIDRIARLKGIHDPESYRIEVQPGYYGEEIEGIYLKDEIAEKLELAIWEALSIDCLEDRIEHLLMLEYGSIHPNLTDCVYERIKADPKDLIFASVSHLKLVKKKHASGELDHYRPNPYRKEKTTFWGIVVQAGDKLKVIDGYHRCWTSYSEGEKKIDLLLAKKIC